MNLKDLFIDKKRIQTFLYLVEGIAVEKIPEMDNISRSAVYKFLDELLNSKLIVKENQSYVATKYGKRIAEKMKPFLETIETVSEEIMKEQTKSILYDSPFTKEELIKMLEDVEKRKKSN